MRVPQEILADKDAELMVRAQYPILGKLELAKKFSVIPRGTPK